MKSIDLDNTRQPELYAAACRAMAECIPGWQDLCPGDPAVAILEYFSYLSHIQNHHMNRVMPSHLRAFLGLLGGKPHGAEPAVLLAAGEEPCYEGQRFHMGDLPFEVVDGPGGVLPKVEQVEFYGEGRGCLLRSGVGMKLPGGENGTFRISLTGALPEGQKLRFWFRIRPEQGRVPPTEETAAPVKFSAVVGGSPALCMDGTCGLLRSGMVEITPAVSGREVLLEARGLWEGRPELLNVVLEPVQLAQQRTRSAVVELTAPFCIPEGWVGNRILSFFTPEQEGWKREDSFYAEEGRVSGWPGEAPRRIRVVGVEPDFAGSFSLRGLAMERIRLEEPGLCADSLRVMVEQNGLWYDCPLCEPERGRTLIRGCRWEPEGKTVYFGDGRDYQPPEPGEVLICRCVVTGGGAVNGAFGPLACGDSVLYPLTDAAGGRTEENAQEAFQRAAGEQQELYRAVTCEDYEVLARQTPGLSISRIRAVPRSMLGEDGAGVVLFVKPSAEESCPVLTPWQKNTLLDRLEPLRMLGVPVEVRSARYCNLLVRVSVVSSEPISRETLRQAALPLTDSLAGPLDFGAEISYTALYAALGRVRHVRQVRRLELIPLSGGARRSQDGSLRLAPDQLPVLTEFEVME